MINYKDMVTTMDHPLYGVFDNRCHAHFVGSTLRAAKTYATKNNFRFVHAIYPADTVVAVAERIDGEWISIE